VTRGVLAAAAAILAVGVAAPVRAQPTDDPFSDYTITTWNENDGLPTGRIWDLQQGTDGYLWLATDAGLVRFDGVRFVPWDAPERSQAILALLRTSSGSLWAGFGGTGGLAHVEGKQARMYGEAEGVAGGYTSNIFEDHNGTIWAAGRAGLHRFRDGRWEKLGPASGLPEGPVLGAFQDGGRRLWVATQNAVLRQDDGAARFERVEVVDITGNYWPQFSEDPAGGVWITDAHAGFRRLEGQPGRSASTLVGRGLNLLHDKRGQLWVATQGQGLWRVRAGPRSAVDVLTARTGLSSDTVRSLLEDREGNIWVGTYAGLHRLSPRRALPLTGLGTARCVEVTPDGGVWIGTNAGLTRYLNGAERRYGQADGLPGSIVLSLHTDEDGTLWVATDRGIARRERERFVPVPMPGGERVGRVFTLTGSSREIWLRDLDSGLFRWKDGRLSPPTELPGVSDAIVSAVYVDRRGNVWYGSEGGRLGVIGPDEAFESHPLAIGGITALHQGPSGVVWVGGGNGLARFANGRFSTIGAAQGFPGNVSSIVEDENGSLWLGLGSGVARLDATEFEKAVSDPRYEVAYRLLDTSDGVAGGPLRIGDPAAARSGDGRLWFITGGGVTIIDPDRLGDVVPPPAAAIEAVTADGERLDPTPGLRLPPNTSHLLIDFTALTLSNPMRVRFRYRLEGFDDAWVDAGQRRQASYANLPPRDYRFALVASSHAGTWSSPAAEFDFTIAPTFYQTGWFYAACVLTLGLVTWMLWQLRVRQVRRQYEMVLAERIRMSRAIHDTLLQGLVGIALHLDDLSSQGHDSARAFSGQIARLRRRVEHYIREARQSIWDLRSPSLDAPDFVSALRSAAERAVGDTPVELEFAVTGSPGLLPPRAEEQFLLIEQEAISNAVRHGHPRRITVGLAQDGNQVRLRVADDGRGFDLDTARRTGAHFGLQSMHERAEQVGGALSITTHPGAGTTIEATAPIGQSH
jgi:signal transduction histidine kinase/ligand-binding sensor domain-containing protein